MFRVLTFLRLILAILIVQVCAEGSETPILKSYRKLDPCDDDIRIQIGADIGQVYYSDSLFLIEFTLKYDPGVVQFNALLENAGITGNFNGPNDSRIVNVFSEDSVIVGNIGTFGSTPKGGNDVLFVLSFNYIGDGSQSANFDLLDLYLGDEYSGTFSNQVEDETIEVIPVIEDKADRFIELFFDNDTLFYQDTILREVPMELGIGNYKNLNSVEFEIRSDGFDLFDVFIRSNDENIIITDQELVDDYYKLSTEINGIIENQFPLIMDLKIKEEVDTNFVFTIDEIITNNNSCITRTFNDSLSISSKFEIPNSIEEEESILITNNRIESLNGRISVMVYDQLGRLKLSKQNIQSIHLNDLEGDMYFVKIVDDRGRITLRKLITN